MKLGSIIAILGLLGFSSADAAVNIDAVKFNGSQVSIELDQAIRKDQVRVEFFRDIVQVSLKNASVYPAKILTQDKGEVKKVFTYQYTPSLVRCRLTVNGKAQDYASRVKTDIQGKTLKISLQPKNLVKDTVVTKKAQARKSVEKPAKKVELSAGEKKLLGRIEKTKTPEKLANGKDIGSPFKGLLWAFALLMFAVVGFVLMKAIRRKVNLPQGLGGSWARFFKKLPVGNGLGKMIEVVSSHHLGAKKSIAVVRVKGRTLLVGITDESINLISDLTSEFSEDAEFGESQFTDVLTSETQTPGMKSSGVRDRIRQKIEGMKSI